MKVLVLGLGRLSLGLVVPLLKSAGYIVIGTDTDQARVTQLQGLQGEYRICNWRGSVQEQRIDAVSMPQLRGNFDVVVTSVGRSNIASAMQFCRQRGISGVVLHAENLPHGLPEEARYPYVPIVVDRICPRIETFNGKLSVVAENTFSVVVAKNQHNCLQQLQGWVTFVSAAELGQRRFVKHTMVNAMHVLVAVWGIEQGLKWVEEAVRVPEIERKMRDAIAEVMPALTDGGHFEEWEIQQLLAGTIQRFAEPLEDPLLRIVPLPQYESAASYLSIPNDRAAGLSLRSNFVAETFVETRELLYRLAKRNR